MDLLTGIAYFTASLTIVAPGIMFLWARSIVNYSPYPYCFTLLSGALLIFYGSRHELQLVIIASCANVLFNMVYISLFFAFATRADHRRRYLGCFLLGAAVIYAIIGSVYLAGCYDLYDGLCTTVSVLVSLAPFMNLLAVPRERWREAMPMPLVPLFAMLNGVASTVRNTWAVPILDVDYHLVIPSAAAALCGLVLSGLRVAIWAQGPPPPPTGLRRPLMGNEEDDQGADRGDHHTKLDIESLKDGNLSNDTNPQDANRVLTRLPPTGVSHNEIQEVEGEKGGCKRLDSGNSTGSRNIGIDIEDVKNVPPTTVDDTLSAQLTIQTGKNVPPPADNGSITFDPADAKNVPPLPPPAVNESGSINVDPAADAKNVPPPPPPAVNQSGSITVDPPADAKNVPPPPPPAVNQSGSITVDPPADAKNVPPPPPPAVNQSGSITVDPPADAKNVPPPPPPAVNQSGSITVDPPADAKLVQEKDGAGHVVVDHTSALTSKEEAELTQPQGDGAAA